jgi:hypothetical protein
MTATKDIDVVVSTQALPSEFQRRSSARRSEEPKIAAMLSGIINHLRSDEVICPTLLRRNLIVPASGAAAASR